MTRDRLEPCAPREPRPDVVAAGELVDAPAICPAHGQVDAIAYRGALVCPNPECRRTCVPRGETLLETS